MKKITVLLLLLYVALNTFATETKTCTAAIDRLAAGEVSNDVFRSLIVGASEGDSFCAGFAARLLMDEKHFKSWGIKQDWALAFKLLKQSVLDKEPQDVWLTSSSMYLLGELYRDGKHVLQNYVVAYAWYSMAASRGYQEATKLRDAVYARLERSSLAAAAMEKASQCQRNYRACLVE